MAVYTLATGISIWLEKRAEKERTIKGISETISQIQNILLPLKTTRLGSIDKPVFDSVRSMGAALKRTKEHLLVWEYKRTHRLSSLFIPSTALGQLKYDAQQLDQQLMLLLTSLAIVQYSHSQNSSSAGSEFESGSSVVPIVAGATRNRATVLDWVENREVKEFWRGYVGEKVRHVDHFAVFVHLNGGGKYYQIQFISELEFRSRLSSWLGETPSHHDEIAAGNSLKDVLKMYMETGNLPAYRGTRC
ncbi:hypothetical protein L208DRAFT_1393546 [Tricholoma matsutake]|nr:hypothetical protein L208DRAFT_1393546 [Tricholoma matsutake 945]